MNCLHCGRVIELAQPNDPEGAIEGRWIDPEATGDDSVWRETCDAHDTFLADHEPTLVEGPSPVEQDPYRAQDPSRAQEDPPSEIDPSENPHDLPDESLEPGVYVASGTGQYGTAEVIALAHAYGFMGNNNPEDLRLLRLALTAASAWSWDESMTPEDHEFIVELGDEAETYLNEKVAPEGKIFGWEEGEFFLFLDCPEIDRCENPEHKDSLYLCAWVS